jgi:hypothetical protein
LLNREIASSLKWPWGEPASGQTCTQPVAPA